MTSKHPPNPLACDSHNPVQRRRSSVFLPGLIVCVLVFFTLTSTVLAIGEEQGPASIIVGGDYNYPPYEFIDKNGQPAGFNVDLTKAVAEIMGISVQIRLGPWEEMRKGLENGSIDILQGMVQTEQRAKRLEFSTPHAIVYQSIWTRKGEEIRSLQELRDKEVLVMQGSVMHDFMMENDLGASFSTTDSLAEALQLLNAGTYDCALVAKLPGQYLIKELKLARIAPTARPLSAQKYGYAAKKSNYELISRFNEGLALLKRSGQFQAIHNKWLGVLEPQSITWQRIGRYVAMVAIPLLLVLGGTVIWSRMLQQKVSQRTAELAREVAEKERALEELRRHQDQLVQANKMASLGILVSGVAHEINNPNGLILLNIPRFAEVFRHSQPILEAHYQLHGDFNLGTFTYTRLREDLPDMFDDTQEAAKRIKRIVDDLKDFARRDTAMLTERVDLNATVSAAIRLIDNAIRLATSSFEVVLASDLPPVRGNSQRIEQVIVNLLLNACQSLGHKDEHICIATLYDHERDQVILTVRDEGRGVTPERLPHLTDPFFTTKRDEGGTGLGLSVSAGIIKDHGGTLTFTPAATRGLIVTVSFPAMKEPLT